MPVLNSLWEWTRTEERAPSAGHDEKTWWDVKDRLARLSAPPAGRRLALIGCATEGVNAIINGLPLKKATSDHVDPRARGRQRRLLNRMQRDGIVIRLFEPDLARAQATSSASAPSSPHGRASSW